MLDPEAQSWFDTLRNRYFPAERLVVGAHVTLFHALPAEAAEAVRARADSLCAETERFGLIVTGLRFLGRGVAFGLSAAQVGIVRARLAEAVPEGVLTAQDRRPGWAPHVTIQNKVSPEEARRTESALASLVPPPVEARGVALWWYRGGPWQSLAAFGFRT